MWLVNFELQHHRTWSWKSKTCLCHHKQVVWCKCHHRWCPKYWGNIANCLFVKRVYVRFTYLSIFEPLVFLDKTHNHEKTIGLWKVRCSPALWHYNANEQALQIQCIEWYFLCNVCDQDIPTGDTFLLLCSRFVCLAASLTIWGRNETPPLKHLE